MNESQYWIDARLCYDSNSFMGFMCDFRLIVAFSVLLGRWFVSFNGSLLREPSKDTSRTLLCHFKVRYICCFVTERTNKKDKSMWLRFPHWLTTEVFSRSWNTPSSEDGLMEKPAEMSLNEMAALCAELWFSMFTVLYGFLSHWRWLVLSYPEGERLRTRKPPVAWGLSRRACSYISFQVSFGKSFPGVCIYKVSEPD